MQISVEVANILAKAAGSSEIRLDFPGKKVITLKIAISELVQKYPKLKNEILDDAGGLNYHLMIFINDRPLQHSDDFSLKLKNGDILRFFPVIGGG